MKTKTEPKTKKYLESQGYVVDKVTYYDSYARRHKDLFGVFDIVAVNTETGKVMFVQSTTKQHITDRIKKMKEAADVIGVLKDNNIFVVVHGWYQDRPRGKWKVKEVQL